jgi:hypothetical protein
MLFGLLVLVCCCKASVSPPVLPRSFVATFVTSPQDVSVPLTGVWFYDFDNQVQRIDGGNQLSCNRVNQAPPQYCTTFLTPQFFYVVFPFTQKCCTGCKFVLLKPVLCPLQLPQIQESSPGLLRPDWLAHDNATLVGQQRVQGRLCDVWLAMGSSKNYWLSERASGFPCLMDDGGYNFTFTSFQGIKFGEMFRFPLFFVVLTE